MSNVAAILINYNGLEDTIESIISLQKQSYKIDIIVVDNYSRLNEGEAIQRKFSNVQVICTSENVGFSGGNNLAIDYAIKKNYDYILLINNDTIADKNLVKELMKQIDENCVCVPMMYYATEPNVIWYAGGKINKHMGTAYHVGMNEIDNGKFDVIRECDFATGCGMLLPTKVIRKVGMLKEDFFMYCEDLDYSIRLSEKDVKIKFIPNAKLWHKVSKSTGGDESAFSIYYMTRNRLQNIKNHRDFFSVEATLVTLITRCIRMFQMWVRGKREWKAFLRAIRDYYQGISGKIEVELE